jgi:SagB-type dehydrogenase family enzyme
VRNKNSWWGLLFVVFGVVVLHSTSVVGDEMKEEIKLPQPHHEGRMSVEQAIKERRTVRSFKPDALTLVQFSQLLWAAQGITDKGRGYRTAPSGGALYPLDVYAVVGRNGVKELDEGVYLFLPADHSLRKVKEEDQRKKVAQAALWQNWVAEAPVVLVITAEYARITKKYGERGVRYAQIEAGHAGQNIFLQAEALGLGAGIVGAFDDGSVAEIIGALPRHEPLLIMPVGRPAAK